MVLLVSLSEDKVRIELMRFPLCASSSRLALGQQMNKILEPRAGGVNLDTAEARLYNYEGITYKDRKVCSRQVHSGDWVPQTWSRDYSMAEVAKKARVNDSPKN